MALSQNKARTVAELAAIAGSFAASLRPGMRVGLRGPLGAGKTTFVKALAAALSCTDEVLSPTYLYHQAYPAVLSTGEATTLHHLDFYRLQDDRDVLALDLPIEDPHGVVLIEWSDRTPALERELDYLVTITVEYDDRLVAIEQVQR